MKTEEESKIEAMLKYLKDKGVIKSWYYNGTYHAELKQDEKYGDSYGEQFRKYEDRIAELKQQIEKMKCCFNCKHSRTEYGHCRTDKHEKWEIKENG